MNKKLLVISLLLLIPACGKKKAPIVCPQQGQPFVESAPVSSEYIADADQSYQTSQELAPLDFEEEENPFEALSYSPDSALDQEEELTLVNAEEEAGDPYSDSANYGLKTIYYDFDHYEIRPDQNAALEHNLSVAKGLVDKGYDISVEGHSCNIARDTQYNIALSEKRAHSVANYFKKNGIKKEIPTLGCGATKTLVPDGDIKQQAPNRRVEIYAYRNKK